MKHWTAAAALSALALASQTQPIAINGRVVADETGEPIVNARVGATTAQDTMAVLAGRDGRFTITVPPGRVRIVAGKTGYAKAETTVAAGTDAIEIRLRRAAAISGRVIDDFGDAVVGARVAAMAMTDAPSPLTIVASADTDDRGEYRLGGLAAGAFIIKVTTAGAITTQTNGDGAIMFMPAINVIFYPGAVVPVDAEVIHVQAGEDRAPVDFDIPHDAWSGQQMGALAVGPFNRAIESNPAGATTGVARGRVSSTDGRAIPHAQVRLVLQGDSRQSASALADADGRFEFTALPPGTFRLLASKAGYESTLDDPPKVELREGETRERVDVTLTPWGSLAGRVFDENGEPLQGASVRVLQVRYEAGRRRLVPAGSAPRLTDDLGRYRLHGLPSGAYIVSASVGDVASADLPGYTRAYYPGTTMPGAAQFVAVGAGQAVTGIDVSLSRARTARVSGKMLSPGGDPTMGGRLQLVPRASSVVTVPAGARVFPDGRFEFTNVPPGQYTIRAQRNQNNPWSEGEFALLPVSVDGADVTGLVLQMSAGSTIRGRVTFDAQDPSKTPDASQIEVTPAPSDFDLAPDRAATARANADMTFVLLGISGPRRLQLFHAPPGWALKEILVRGLDVTDRVLPFGSAEQSLNDVDVVLTDRVSELSGVVTDDHGQPAPGAHVLVFATGRDRWYPGSRFMRTAIAGTAGAFSITGLPFSAYYAAAAPKLPPYGDDAWQDPEFLDTLARSASSVTIREGEKKVLTLTLPSTVK